MLSKIFSRAGRKLAAVCLVTATTFFSGLVVNAASNVDGAIVASVVTSSGDGVSGATVTVTNAGTGFTRTLTTNADGEVRFSSLAVGTYDVSVSSSAGNASRTGVIVNVGTGTSVTLIAGGDTAELGGLSVTAQLVSPIDISSTESATILGEATIDRLPVGRNVTAVALLAPGTTRGDAQFGNLASFGGSTVGENVCYINGLNVTDFNNGLGCSSVPFEFYQEFQLKTGGYSAEFGRSTGGVVNAVTKSGTNDYHYGFNLYYTPWISSLSGTDPNVYYQTGEIFQDNEDDEQDSLEMNLWASGPIIKDKAFFYVLYNPRDVNITNQTRGEGVYIPTDDKIYGVVTEEEDNSAFWGLKLDFDLSSNHRLELLAFSDEQETTRTYYEIDNTTLARIRENSKRIFDNGGVNYSLRYTGYITPDFTLSAMYGQNEYDNSYHTNNDNVSAVVDYRYAPSGDTIRVGSLAAGSVQEATDTREALRIDGEWFLGDHALKFGIDNETNTSNQDTRYTGTVGTNVLTGSNFAERSGAIYYVRNSNDIRVRTYHNPNSEFETTTNAIYIEDKWQVTDDVMLSLGLRNESFTNANANGVDFIDISSQIAPRLGIAWDAMGDGTLKVFANYGRYFLPVANNTNVRLAGREYYVESRYFGQDLVNQGPGNYVYQDECPTNPDVTGDGIGDGPGDCQADYNASGIPILGAPRNIPLNIFADGTVKPTTQSVDQDIDPMYQDEFILGFTKDMGNNWSVGVRAIFRDLKSTIEDIAIDAALNDYAAANGHAAFIAEGFDYYVLTNPGDDVTMDVNFTVDIDGDGIVNHSDQVFSQVALIDPAAVKRVTIDSKAAGYPESERYYNAVEFLFERAWDGVWFLQGSYTWSQSYGNNEGFVRSDNGQDDAGLTTLFDQPGLLDGAYGYLPNDRRHALKVFGAYQFAPGWQVGMNVLMESGRPINAFGEHPSDGFAWAYGAEAFYQDAQLVPRGSRGRTGFRTAVDLSLQYATKFGEADVKFGVDVFNVFNSQVATEVDEVAEFFCDTLPPGYHPAFPTGINWPNDGSAECATNPSYGLATSHQPPRSVRLTAEVSF